MRGFSDNASCAPHLTDLAGGVIPIPLIGISGLETLSSTC